MNTKEYNQYNLQGVSTQNNYLKLQKEINDLSNKQFLDKAKSVEIMYTETKKLENKEYALFVGTSILTTIIVIATYKIIIK
jgi:hypothetical protein